MPPPLRQNQAAKSGKKKMVVFLVVAVVSLGAGAAVPAFLGAPKTPGQEQPSKAADVYVPFGEVTVNLAEKRLTRYLRVKVILVTDTHHESSLTEELDHRKARLKNWLIAHLSDKALADVTGQVSINRVSREIQEQFNTVLSHDGTDVIRAVLFEEFVVQ